MKNKTNPIAILAIILALVSVTTTFADKASVRAGVDVRIADSSDQDDDNDVDEDVNDDVNDDDNDADEDRDGEDRSKSDRGFLGLKSFIQNMKGDKEGRESSDAKTPRERAIREIDRRIAGLTKLEARIDAMKRISASSKTSLKATAEAQITSLTALRAKIIADTDDAVLAADIASITKGYRIYMLVIPQGALIASAERISATADIMATFGTKLETRIAAAKTAGSTVTTLETTYADYKVQLAEAKANAAAAITLTASLKPDNGSQAIIDANQKAMTDARAKLVAARADLQAARQDAQTIVKGLKELNVKAEVDADSNNDE